jgi:S1-C subfamily serine protease
MNQLLMQLSDGLADVNAQLMRSLVQVRQGERSIGAGTIWRADGLIVTNAHVVQTHGRIGGDLRVRLHDGRNLPARVVAIDSHHDLAALRVDVRGLPAVVCGDSRSLQAGQLVLAFGFPWGVSGGATVGSVIVAESGQEREGRREWLAASLHLRPGHSGGPMVNASGRLVGINTMMNGPDVGVAVPVHIAQAFLQREAMSATAPPLGVVMV